MLRRLLILLTGPLALPHSSVHTLPLTDSFSHTLPLTHISTHKSSAFHTLPHSQVIQAPNQ